MKIVVNQSSGGYFALNPFGVVEYQRLLGNACYAYKQMGWVDDEHKNPLFRKITDENELKRIGWGDRVYCTNSDYGKYTEGFIENKISCELFERDDPLLVYLVQMYGQEVAGWGTILGIIEIPDDVEWVIAEENGFEWVEEKHMKWGYPE